MEDESRKPTAAPRQRGQHRRHVSELDAVTGITHQTLRFFDSAAVREQWPGMHAKRSGWDGRTSDACASSLGADIRIAVHIQQLVVLTRRPGSRQHLRVSIATTHGTCYMEHDRDGAATRQG